VVGIPRRWVHHAVNSVSFNKFSGVTGGAGQSSEVVEK
jgi:hypothetical protein